MRESSPHADLILSSQAALAALLLSRMDLDCEPEILARLMGVSEEEIKPVMDELLARGLMTKDEFGRARGASSIREDTLLKYYRHEPAPDSLAKALERYFQHRYKEFFRLSLGVLRTFIRNEYFLSARQAYDVIVKLFISIKVPFSRRDVCADFIHYGMEIQREMQHFPWNVRHALILYYKMRGTAFFLGDTRSLGIIDLGIGYMNISLRSPQKAAFYQQVMLRGIHTIHALGDADILQQSSGQMCFYYFVEGKFTKAMNCAYSTLFMPDLARFGGFGNTLYFYAALSALCLGEYDVAMNILILAMDKAARMAKLPEVQSVRALLAHVYVLQCKDEEALEIIDSIIGTHHLSVLTYAELWASRTLAYYHYLRGNVYQSYICFKSWQQKATIMGITHANYLAAPFVLELLAVYYMAGFAPPLQYTLQEELAVAMQSPSSLMRCVALRISGVVRAREWGWTDSLVREHLQSSLDLFRTFSAPIEMARTLIALARMHRARSEEERAAIRATEAWSIHQQYGQPEWPGELDSLLNCPPRQSDSQFAMTPATFCARLFQTVKQQFAWDSEEAFFSSLLYALLATFGVARGGIFRMEKGHALLVFGVDITEKQMDTVEFAARQRLLRQAAISRQAVYGTLVDEQNAEAPGPEVKSASPGPQNGFAGPEKAPPTALFLAADTEGQSLYLVYLEGQLHRQVEALLGPELFTLLDNYLAAEISIQIRRSVVWRDQVRSVALRPPRLAEANPILFRTQCMRELMGQVGRLADKDASVLILGESGVGKELIARRLHELSGRTGGFIGVNLASTPDELFESEFYGHEKGSFTGANYQKRGLFELADKGTLFIDEVGDIPPRLQVKLLRVLQERQFMRVGGTRLLKSDFRLLAATNRNLKAEVRDGRFREDLYYRLNVVPLHVPPLRERPEDILYLAEHFLQFFVQRHRAPNVRFSEAERRILLEYSWPGNVRELKNYVERYTLLPEKERRLAPPSELQKQVKEDSLSPEVMPPERRQMERFSAMPSLEDMQNQYFEYVYTRAGGVVSGPDGVATVLKISRTTAYAWIEKLKLREKFARRLVER